MYTASEWLQKEFDGPLWKHQPTGNWRGYVEFSASELEAFIERVQLDALNSIRLRLEHPELYKAAEETT